MAKQFFEKFDSVNEFLNTIEKRPVLKSFSEKTGSNDPDFEWTGTRNFEEANRLFMYGDKVSADKLNDKLRKIKAQGKGNETRNNLYNSPCGFLPIVPKVLAGDPQNMLAIRKETYKSTKVINIVYSMSCSGSTPADVILEASAKLVEVICQLEKNGYRINLYTGDNAKFNNAETAFIIKIKDSGKYIDTLRLAYPLINPSFLRRHSFRWLERYPNYNARGYYGSPMTGTEFRQMLSDKIKNAKIISIYDIMGKDTEQIAKFIENGK